MRGPRQRVLVGAVAQRQHLSAGEQPQPPVPEPGLERRRPALDDECVPLRRQQLGHQRAMGLRQEELSPRSGSGRRSASAAAAAPGVTDVTSGNPLRSALRAGGPVSDRGRAAPCRGRLRRSAPALRFWFPGTAAGQCRRHERVMGFAGFQQCGLRVGGRGASLAFRRRYGAGWYEANPPVSQVIASCRLHAVLAGSRSTRADRVA
jgi:hypothetical protein